MKYQINSKSVEEYIELVQSKLNIIEELIKDKEYYMNSKLIWNSEAGKNIKNLYQIEINKQMAYCNSIKMYLNVYERGIYGFGETHERLKKEFERLKEENIKLLLRGDIDEYKYRNTNIR